VDFILWQYDNSVLPAAREYLLPSKSYADLVLENNSDLATAEQSLYDAINKKHAFVGAR
jgi:uridine kinase